MTLRIGRGEFFDPEEEPTSPEQVGRTAFLGVVAYLDREDRREDSSVMGSLEADVYPLYRERFGPDDVVRWDGAAEAQGGDPLDAALIAWASRWHLCEPWVLDSALATMRQALRLGRFPDHFVQWAGVGRALGRMVFEATIYEPDLMSRASYIESQQARFDRFLASHCDEREAEARSKGWQRTPSKRGAFDWGEVLATNSHDPAVIDRAVFGQDAYRHFRILARWQVHGWTRDRIAKEFHAAKPTVDSALRDTAALIGLELRKGRRGRPRKNSHG